MVLPSTKLGYTLGIKRDRDIISPRERQKASPFKGRRIRMAGEKASRLYSLFGLMKHLFLIQKVLIYLNDLLKL